MGKSAETEEWKPPVERKLEIRWTCIVCRCDETSGKRCRVINRPPGTLTLAHLQDPRFEAVLEFAESASVSGDQTKPAFSGRVGLARLRELAILMRENLDDVICVDCDPDSRQKLTRDGLERRPPR